MDELTKKNCRHRASAKKLVAKIVEAMAYVSPESPEKDVVWLRRTKSHWKTKSKP